MKNYEAMGFVLVVVVSGCVHVDVGLCWNLAKAADFSIPSFSNPVHSLSRCCSTATLQTLVIR